MAEYFVQIFALKIRHQNLYVIKYKANRFSTVLNLNYLEFRIPSAVTLFVIHAGLSLIKQLIVNFIFVTLQQAVVTKRNG